METRRHRHVVREEQVFFSLNLHMCALNWCLNQGQATMFESLNEPVDVLSAFLDGRVRPLRFRWKGHVVRVRRVTGEWSRREGTSRLTYFSVEGPGTETYELCYDPRGPRWVLCKAWASSEPEGA